MEKIRRPKILIVEDEAPAALALGDALESEGYEVLRETDGNGGLKSALTNHPDLILADLKMPHMGGMEMIAEIRKDSWGKDAKVIILTNISDLETLNEAMKHDAFHYLVKGDSSMGKIIETVRTQIGLPEKK